MTQTQYSSENINSIKDNQLFIQIIKIINHEDGSSTITFDMNDYTHDILDKHAKNKGISLEDVIIEAINFGINKFQN